MQQLLQGGEMRDVRSREESIFNITIEGFDEVQKAGLSLDQLFLLECFNEGTDVSKHIHSSKILAWRQTLQRKDYINEAGYLTVSGKNLLRCVREGKSFSELQTVELNKKQTEFDLWWKAYPSTDVFEHQGKKFERTRSLKNKKDDCRKKFYDIINEGQYSADDLIKALETEVLMKKDASVKERENKLKYMQNSLTYLNNKGFESFIELSKTYKPIIKPNSITDI